LGFAYKPKDIKDIVYFIKNLNSGDFPVDKNRAILTYYLAQKSNWLFTPFTPMGSDFDEWLEIGVDKLLNEHEVKVFFESLEKEIPLSYINHKYAFNNSIED
jgi:hypothetical protein